MAQIEVTRPHIALPFEFRNGVLRVQEQDTLDEIFDSVQAIVRTPRGSRIDNPDFGITTLDMSSQDLTESEEEEEGLAPAHFSLERLRAEILEHEPRAQLLFEDKPGILDEFARQITISVGGLEE